MPAGDYLDPARKKKFPPLLAILIVLVFLAAISLVDYRTGYELSVSIFYLIPITLAVLLLGRNFGLVAAVLSALLLVFIDLAAGKEVDDLFVAGWNAAAGSLYYVFHALLLSALLGRIARIREVSYKDPLTGAANWRYFQEYLEANLKELPRGKGRMAIAYLDVDDFKAINDALGHEAGDGVLKTLVESAKGNIRANDMVARLGGDEFAILLAGVDGEEALEILNRIRGSMAAAMAAQGRKATLSIGAIVFSDAALTVRQIISYVDEVMYKVKNGGKDGLRIESR